jgi:hypothetical protein
MSRVRKPPLDQVDRARLAVDRAIGRIVKLLGDEDIEVLGKTALTLADLGPYVAGPLAAAPPRAPTPCRHRGTIIAVLSGFDRQPGGAVHGVLLQVLQKEKNPIVWQAARMELNRLISLEIMDRVAKGSRPGAKPVTRDGPPPRHSPHDRRPDVPVPRRDLARTSPAGGNR